MRYSKVSRRMWNDAKFRSLSRPQPNGQSLWQYLLTGPELTNVPGCIPIGEAALAEALGWSLKGFREAFREVFREGLAEADWDARFVWVPNAIKHNAPQSPNVVKSWAATWDLLPECELKAKAYQDLKAFVEGLGEGFAKAFQEAIPKDFPKPRAGAGAGTRAGAEPPLKPPQGGMGVEDVFSAWVEITGRDPKRTKLNGKRRQRIRARLNEGYTPDRLIAAIRGVMRSPWHIGDNPDGKTYTDLGTVLRDGEQVEKFERLANAPVPVKRADIPKRIEELNRRRIRLEQEISGCSDEDYPRLLEQHTAVKREMGELEAHA